MSWAFIGVKTAATSKVLKLHNIRIRSCFLYYTPSFLGVKNTKYRILDIKVTWIIINDCYQWISGNSYLESDFSELTISKYKKGCSLTFSLFFILGFYSMCIILFACFV